MGWSWEGACIIVCNDLVSVMEGDLQCSASLAVGDLGYKQALCSNDGGSTHTSPFGPSFVQTG